MDPITPGQFLRALLMRRKMSVVELAQRCGVASHKIHSIIYRGTLLPPELWVKFELITGIPAARWRDMEVEHQLQRARQRNEKRRNRITGADGSV